MNRRGRRAVVLVAIAFGLIVLFVLDHVYLSSMVVWVALRNDCEYPVKVEYSGSTIFERGTVALEPGQRERVYVFRGDRPPVDGYAVRVRVWRRSEEPAQTREFANIPWRGGPWTIRIDGQDVTLCEYAFRPDR